jgi:mycoredoxin
MPLLDRFLGRPTSVTQADAAGRQGVVIYWRGGCAYCLRLRFAVRRQRDRATWVNIWDDHDAAAYVRTTNAGGFETVPTVVIDGVPHTNPAPKLVVDALTATS